MNAEENHWKCKFLFQWRRFLWLHSQTYSCKNQKAEANQRIQISPNNYDEQISKVRDKIQEVIIIGEAKTNSSLENCLQKISLQEKGKSLLKKTVKFKSSMLCSKKNEWFKKIKDAK